MRARVASSMPQPLSLTAMRTAPKPLRRHGSSKAGGSAGSSGPTVSIRNPIRPGCPCSACTALVPRLSSTCPSRVASARMAGPFGATSLTSWTLEPMAVRSRLQVSVTMASGQTGVRASGCWRLKARIWRTSSRPRRAALLISCRLCRAGWPVGRSWRARSALPRMAARMLLKSCATPPASVPSASIFCDCASCCSRARCCCCIWRSAVMSTKVKTTWRRPPSTSFSG